MDIYELRSFIVLAEQLHFGRAARALNLSQPALTKQIHKLEDELGSPLFERGAGGTKLTTVGELWLQQARDVVARFDQIVAQGRKAATGQIGRLSIGFGFHTLELVPRVVVKLRAAAPATQITLRDMSTAEQSAALLAGRLDVGFMRMPLSPEADFATLPVIEDRLALISSQQAERPANLRLEDCRNEPFVAISKDRSPGFYNHMLALCAAHGFHPRVVQEVTEFTTAMALVRAGMGMTMIPESFWKNRFAGVQLHRIPDKAARWSVAAVWRRQDTNPILQQFIRLLQKEL